MKFAFKFSNLIGTVYRKGNLLFTPDGNTVVTPVGNRLSFFDLRNNKSETLPIESRYNFTAVDIAPSGYLFIAINETGEALLCSLVSRTVLHRHHFRKPVACVKFSPNGKYFAVTKDNAVFVYRTPGHTRREYVPFALERVITTAYDETTCIEWSSDSRLLAVGSKDMSVKVFALHRMTNFAMVTLGSHSDVIVNCFFDKDSADLYTLSRNGQLCVWEANCELADFVSAQNKKASKEDKLGDEDDLAEGGVTAESDITAEHNVLPEEIDDEPKLNESKDTFEVFVWSLQTGRLLDVLAGHQSCVSGLSFGPGAESVLVSSSWDKTCRIWNLFAEKGGGREALPLAADGLAVQFRPDGQEFAVATLDGAIVFFEPRSSTQVGSIEGRQDLASGRRDTDLITAKRLTRSQAFTALCYTADGECILAAGRSKFVCIYHVREQLLLKKFEISCNHSLDGIDDFVSRRKMTEFGNMALVEEREAAQEAALSLPGVKKGDLSSRGFKPEVRVSGVCFSPTGRSWAAVTTEGVLVYSLDQSLVFDPFELEQNVTPATIRAAAKEKDYARAITTAFRLNEDALTTEVVESVPPESVELVARSLPQVYVEKLLAFLGGRLESTTHVQFYVEWIDSLLRQHGEALKERSGKAMATLRTLLKNVTLRHAELAKVCDHNKYLLRYVETLRELKERKGEKGEADDADKEADDAMSSDVDSEDMLVS
ncbi:WD-repeat protein, putative [Ixodes scapularis]|uniref:WD-repeat protein, putative n=1 Tax=Ixodes scapularis TaxID=6945 RepID=B7P1J3_IXOSC|nr:WD-repeat protein, putative [Ixodes scapularis]|eukprot:XP_002433401.1 WD-repeat protein, putative [Ixodes scapularis]